MDKMSMNPIPRKVSDEDQKLIDEYLKNGGKVTIKPRGEVSDEITFTNGMYRGRRKKSKDD